MSIFKRFSMCVGLLLIAGLSTLHAQTLEDFEQGHKWAANGPGKLGVTCEVVDSPMRQGKSLQVAWDVPRDKYFEVYINSDRPVIEGFDEGANPYHGVVSFDVFSPGSDELHRMAVRFIDSEGEVFQWSTAVQMKEEGWHTATINISPDNFVVSWGGKKENPGKIDGQCRLVSLTFDFDSKVTPNADAAKRRVFFDNIAIKLPQAKVAAAKPDAASTTAQAQTLTIENYEVGNVWQVYKPEDFKANCALVDAPERQGKSLKVQWDLPRAKYFENYVEPKVLLEDFEISGNPYHGTMTIDVYSPGTAEVSGISLRLRDSEQETHQWSSRVDLSKEGWHTITFDISPDNIKDSWGGKQENPRKLDGKIYLSGIAVGFNTTIAAADDAAKRCLFLDNVTLKIPAGHTAPKADASSTDAPKPVAGSANLNAISVGLNTGHPMHIVDPKSPHPAYMTFTNKSAKTQNVVMDLKATSFLGREYKLQKTLELPGKKTVEYFLPLPQDQQDLWWIYYTLIDPVSSQTVSDRELLGVMSPTGNNPTYQPKDRFLFGMCAHSGRYDDQTMQMEALATGLIGVDISRTAITWGGVQPTADTWKWDKLDRLVELYRAQNVELQYLCAFTPQWATTGDATSKDWLVWSRAAPKLDAWETYLKNVVGRYHNDIRFWEIWNEPDLPFFRGTAEEYIQMCKVAYPAIKSTAPEVTVLSGGWSAADRNPGFIEKVLSQNEDTYDILAVHAHGFFGSFQKIVDVRWGDLRKQYVKNKPIYFNETGLSSPGDTIQADTQQAVELVRKVTFTMGRGAMAYNWYDLRHDGDNPNDHEHRYGMITRDFQAKPAYITYNNLIGTLRGYKRHSQITASADQWLFLFEKDDSYVLVGWAQQPYAVGQIVLGTDSTNVQRVDMMGNRQTLPRLADGSVVVGLEMRPAYWVFDKASKAPAMSNSLIELAGVAAWIPNQDNDVKFNFTNPLKNKADFVFRVQLPQSLGGSIMQFDKTVDAGKTVAMTLPMGIVSGDVDFARPFACIMQYQDRNYQLNGSCQIPIQWAGVIQKGAMPDKPTFVLDDRDQVFDSYIGDPSTKHRLWTGPKDLSAQTWIWATNKALNLRIVVNDDMHVQTNPENELWRSDCIQLAMQLPGQNGQWEINLARSNDGKSQVNPGIVPHGLDASAVNNSTLKTSASDGKVVFELTLPLSALHISADKFAEGVYLSMLVNDDDGEGRDGWIALSSGIGNGKDPSCYPLFVVK